MAGTGGEMLKFNVQVGGLLCWVAVGLRGVQAFLRSPTASPWELERGSRC